MTNVQKFYEALGKDEKLQEKSKKLNKKHEEKKPTEYEVIAETVEFAKAEGYSFTEAEFKEYIKNKQAEITNEIDEDELGAVAGGFISGVTAPEDLTGGCACSILGGGGGTHNGGATSWGCGCAAYGQGGDARDWHVICLCKGLGGGSSIL
ncbi:MAG: Nif11-like leader peptide family natural product precursor [Oscillospiraceae bacterium]|nr:Nif11-like leader peptide family natural product precursor [Oscillospiraceae bacterium]MCL2279646.1 Nif11-like leader peptide family natural product precursor [Oscillospiraceae bacterium]